MALGLSSAKSEPAIEALNRSPRLFSEYTCNKPAVSATNTTVLSTKSVIGVSSALNDSTATLNGSPAVAVASASVAPYSSSPVQNAPTSRSCFSMPDVISCSCCSSCAMRSSFARCMRRMSSCSCSLRSSSAIRSVKHHTADNDVRIVSTMHIQSSTTIHCQLQYYEPFSMRWRSSSCARRSASWRRFASSSRRWFSNFCTQKKHSHEQTQSEHDRATPRLHSYYCSSDGM